MSAVIITGLNISIKFMGSEPHRRIARYACHYEDGGAPCSFRSSLKKVPFIFTRKFIHNIISAIDKKIEAARTRYIMI